MSVELLSVTGLPEVAPGDDLAVLIAGAIDLVDGDIVVVTSKIVSKAEGRVVDLVDVTPSPFADDWASRWEKDPRVVEVVLTESRRIVRQIGPVLITETRHGLVCANSGVDQSSSGAHDRVVVLPEDPDASARGIRKGLRAAAGVDVAVIVSDTFGRPWREGQTDVAIGIASSGFHSNGYSLIRKVVFEMAGLSLSDTVPECDDKTVSELLLEPTRLYARAVRSVLRHYRVKQVVHGIAHITGGGLAENLGRIVPDNVQIQIDRNSWEVPPVFGWLQRLGQIEAAEMDRVFNMGLGMVLVVSPHFADSIQHQLAELGMTAWRIGEAAAAEPSSPRVVVG